MKASSILSLKHFDTFPTFLLKMMICQFSMFDCQTVLNFVLYSICGKPTRPGFIGTKPGPMSGLNPSHPTCFCSMSLLYTFVDKKCSAPVPYFQSHCSCFRVFEEKTNPSRQFKAKVVQIPQGPDPLTGQPLDFVFWFSVHIWGAALHVLQRVDDILHEPGRGCLVTGLLENIFHFVVAGKAISLGLPIN